MRTDHFIVIGNGPAGFNAALTLREKAPHARVTIISRETGSHYSPHLLPGFIAGNIKEDAVFPFSYDIYREKRIKLRNRQSVKALDLSRREIVLSHNEAVPFDGLIIAAGGKPRIIEPLLVFRDFVFTLKTLNDARAWIKILDNTDTVLITGGDLTSLAFSRTLISMGKKVFFLLNKEAFWPVRYSPYLFSEVAKVLTGKGIEVLEEGRIKSITKLSENRFEAVIGSTTFKAGAIGAFFGLTPDIRFLADSGLHIDRGILVDQFLYTGYESIYAAGDCAQIYHPELRDYWVSIGYANAVDFGNTAAANLLGDKIATVVPKESILQVDGVSVNTSWWQNF